jgi:FixJ family two-component response regulator
MSNSDIRVAIVDDDASVRIALGRLLAASAFNIETFGSAREFLISIRKLAFDCLVVDLHMPDITGLELQHLLQRAGVKLPTVVITAYNEPGIRERCQQAGAAAFLLKPLSGETLVRTINDAVRPFCKS